MASIDGKVKSSFALLYVAQLVFCIALLCTKSTKLHWDLFQMQNIMMFVFYMTTFKFFEYFRFDGKPLKMYFFGTGSTLLGANMIVLLVMAIHRAQEDVYAYIDGSPIAESSNVKLGFDFNPPANLSFPLNLTLPGNLHLPVNSTIECVASNSTLGSFGCSVVDPVTDPFPEMPVVIGLLYVISVPWYRETGAPLRIWLGLPDWVACRSSVGPGSRFTGGTCRRTRPSRCGSPTAS